MLGGEEPGAIAGRVTTATGEPMSGVAVMIGGSSPPHPDIAALTGDDGRFRFDDLVPGPYQLVINTGGADPRTESVEVSAGGVSRIEVTIGS
jgi:iron complex outermembrane receptor protein